VEAVAERVFQIPGVGHKIAVETTQLVDDTSGSEHDVHFWLALEDLYSSADGPLGPKIVGIQPSEDLALAKLPTPIDGVEGSAIRLRQPANSVAVSLEDAQRAIRGTAVNDDTFEVGVVLGENTLERGRKVASVILARDDNRNGGPGLAPPVGADR
jgi:hypothetical protein